MKYIENTALREWVKEELRVSIFQMAHKLSIQTGCEVLVKLQDSVDHSGCQYYATRTLNLQYMDKGLSKQPWEVMVSGVTGLPVSSHGVQSHNQNGSLNENEDDAELSNDGTIEDSTEQPYPNNLSSGSLDETMDQLHGGTRRVKHELQSSEDASNIAESWTKLNSVSLPFPVALESALVNQETGNLDVLNQNTTMNDDQLQQHIYIYANTNTSVKDEGQEEDDDPEGLQRRRSPPALNYKCTLCQKRCSTVALLVRHAKSFHAGDENMRYHCVLCNREYKHARHLDQHTDLHSKASYRCATCCKGFYRSSTLREHELRDHQGRYRYYCPKCHKGFMRPSTMQTHLSRSHPMWFASKRVNPISIAKSSTIQGISVLNLVPNHDGEGTSAQDAVTIQEGEPSTSEGQGDQNNDGAVNTTPSNIQVIISKDAPKQTQKKMMKVVYQCKECGQMYDMANSLVRHIQDRHSKIKFRCNLCTYRTSRKSDLARHKRARHPVALAQTVSIAQAVVEEPGVETEMETEIGPEVELEAEPEAQSQPDNEAS